MLLTTQRLINRVHMIMALMSGLGLTLFSLSADVPSAVAQAVAFAGPTASQPLALSADGSLLMVANPDNDSVTLFEVADDINRHIATVAVEREPNSVAILPNGSQAYVANTISGTVSVLSIPPDSVPAVTASIPVGTEPYGLALTPNGTRLYVTNARSNSVSVIDTQTNQVIQTIPNVGFEPRGLAITNDGDADDTNETVYVTQFLALPVAIGRLDGEDDSKVGLLTVLSTATNTIVGTVVLTPLEDSGFLAAGDAIGRIAPEEERIFPTGAYPNQLNNVAFKGNFAYVPSTGSSPNGPVRFDVNTQSLLSVVNRSTHLDTQQTLNMHLAVAGQSNPSRLFITQPWAMAFKYNTNEGYVVSAASNIVVKVVVDPITGVPTVQNDPFDLSRVLQIRVGKNPRGIVINAEDTRAYVMNYISRDVTVLDLTQIPESIIATLRSADLPTPGTPEDVIHIGKELFNTSIGVFDPPAPGQLPLVGRMSANGWGACSTCHPFGLSDNVVWIFATGPRRTIPLHADFDPTDAARTTQRVLNWSGIFDEEEDFELNIRNVSGGAGLIVLDDGVTPDPNVGAFDPANANRRQLTVRGIPAWNAIKAYEQFGIRAPISPISKTDPDVIAGQNLFTQANCQSCHGGPQWTSGLLSFIPPPDPSIVAAGQLIEELQPVGTFDPNLLNEVRANAQAPLGADGFVPPSLLSLFAFQRAFFHNGAVDSLQTVLDNVVHRSAGSAGVDLLDDAELRRQLIQFLLSIDVATPPIPSPN
jgi:YVTN family beta-propeller protein